MMLTHHGYSGRANSITVFNHNHNHNNNNKRLYNLMKKFALVTTVLCLSFAVFNLAFANPASNTKINPVKKEWPQRTDIQLPKYQAHLIGSGSFLYLRPAASDADLQYGTFLTLTAIPPLLRAVMQPVTPTFRPTFNVMMGYQLPNSNDDIRLSYFAFHQGYKNFTNTMNPSKGLFPFQFIQTYLGNSFGSAVATASENVQQATLTLGHHVIIGGDLYLHPYFGISYVHVNREFNNFFKTAVLNPRIASGGSLSGVSHSRFNGVGPILGTDFDFPLSHAFSFIGSINTALLVGRLNYALNSRFVLGGSVVNYHAYDFNKSHVVPVINTELGVRYTHPIHNEPYSAVLEAGYQVSDYMKAIGRLYPLNGFANNPAGTNPPSFSTLSSLGFDGPFIRLAILQRALITSNALVSYSTYPSQLFNPGWFITITNLYLQPFGSNRDLNYAILHTPSGSRNIHTNTYYHWAGALGFGYLFESNNTDIQFHFIHLKSSDKGVIIAGANQSISSLNASGPGGVVFANASSRIKYKFNRFNISVGKYFELHRMLIRLFTGVGVAHIAREQVNNYIGGMPSTATAVKYPRLSSDYLGVGPLFGLSGQIPLTSHLSVIAKGSVAVLVGSMNSTLNQNEANSIGVPSFTRLRTNGRRYLVPTAAAKLGLRFSMPFHDNTRFQISAGFRASDYFKAINLLYPVFRTGLGQTNSNFAVMGPYLTISITGI